MSKKPLSPSSPPPFLPLVLFSLLLLSLPFDGFVTATAEGHAKFKDVEGPFVVTKEQRQTVTQTENGQISSVETSDGLKGNYHLQFITLEPNSLFLPVLLHADMVFYVHTGRGSLSWIDLDDNKKKQIDVQRGDIYRIPSGSVLYIRSSLESEREKLRIYAIFTTTDNNENPQPLFTGAYSTLSDLVLGFDKKALQEAFKVPQEVFDQIIGSEKPPAIVHVTSRSKKDQADWRTGIIQTLVGTDPYDLNKKKRAKTFNIFKKKPDFRNRNGWSLAVSNREFNVLRGSDIGVFMVNLTRASMMGPHWNPRAGEISVVTHGQGMIRVVCSSGTTDETIKGCKNTSFRVKEGDIFVVPRFHPMAQVSFNNDSLVFMGFTTQGRMNYPQFLAGRSSVLQTLNRDVLAMSFNVPNTTIDQLLDSQVDSIIVECVSCAEEEEKKMQEEIAREKEEERKREEEERRKREEEEKAREREREEEEARRREEAKRQQEEERKRQEEAARREQEEARKQEEERQAREEQARREEERRQQEEAKKRQEEEARKEEEEAKRQEEERQARERQEEEERQRREEEARRQEEERQAREKREEEERQERGEGEESHSRQEEETRERREEEEARREEERRKQEAAARKEEEEAKRQEEERQERQEEAARKEEQEAKRQEEERQAREEEARREEARREQEEARRRQEEAATKEEEAAKRQEEERQAREKREEEERQRREEAEAASRRAEEERQRREAEEAAAARREEAERQRRQEEEAAARREEAERQQREREHEETRRKEEARRAEVKERVRGHEEAGRGGGGAGGGGKGRRILKKMWRV